MKDKNTVYLACYHGKATKYIHRLCDNITRFFTRGKYSHCEIVVDMGNGRYACYSSSYRDGGVRCKTMELDPQKWDLYPLAIRPAQIEYYFEATKGSGYDLLGALGVVSGLRHRADKYFCSEWCFNAITGGQEGWRFSPTQLGSLACLMT